MEKIIKKIKVTTILNLITGLHIGASNENVEIGGIDNAVIKLSFKSGQPYIPGSSLRGKMRCLLEQTNGAADVGKDDYTNKLFGSLNNISKLIVRDSLLTAKSEKELRECESLELLYTESKSENSIDRTTGTAGNPRQTERVPAGAAFNVEFVVNVWSDDNEKELLEILNKAMNLLENDYLGGSGSRGYGQIQFGKITYEAATQESNWKMEQYNI